MPKDVPELLLFYFSVVGCSAPCPSRQACDLSKGECECAPYLSCDGCTSKAFHKGSSIMISNILWEGVKDFVRTMLENIKALYIGKDGQKYQICMT